MLSELEKTGLPQPQFLLDGEVMPPQPNSDQLPAMFRAGDVSLWLGVSYDMLAKARQEGSGPPFVVIGTTVLYPEDELLAWARATRLVMDEAPRRRR